MEKNEAFSTFVYFEILQVFPDFHEGGQGSLMFSWLLWVSFLAERNLITASELSIYSLYLLSIIVFVCILSLIMFIYVLIMFI